MTTSSPKPGLVALGVLALAMALAQIAWANLPPTVGITEPAPSLTLTGLAIGVIISATATDTDGTVTNVAFFDRARLLGSLTNPPFQFRTSLGPGPHTLTAQATDNAGASTTSADVVVMLTEPSPLVIGMTRPQPGNVALRWSGGSGPFIVQRTANLSTSWCSVLPASLGNSLLLSEPSEAEFFRVVDVGTSSTHLTVSLTGAAVRPNPVATSASGAGTLQLEGNHLSFDIAFTNLSSPGAATQLRGPAGTAQSADVLVDLASFQNGKLGTSGRLSGSVVLTPEEETAVLNGVTYIEFAGPAHPGGEIRGQVEPDLAALESCVRSPFNDLRISFRLDPWLIGGTYGGGFWVSPPSLGPVSQGPTFTIELRAEGLTQARSVVALATWTPADPQMVVVSAHQGQKVAVTVQRPGETSIEVVSQGARKTLSISATTNAGGALLVRLTQ